MTRFARIDSKIRAGRLILANRFRVPELNPFFANRASGGENCESQVRGDSRGSLTRYENRVFFLRIDSRESPRFAGKVSREKNPPQKTTHPNKPN